MAENNKKCFNCKFASEPFKINGNTHFHCYHTKHDEGLKSGDLSAWDTLRMFYDTCDDHQLNEKTSALPGVDNSEVKPSNPQMVKQL